MLGSWVRAPSGSPKRRTSLRSPSLVIRLGLEPKTPTLKVLCSTCWASESNLIFFLSKVPEKSGAVWTGLEPATPCVTGRYSNQLNYHTMVDCYHSRLRVQRYDYFLNLQAFGGKSFKKSAYSRDICPKILPFMILDSSVLFEWHSIISNIFVLLCHKIHLL